MFWVYVLQNPDGKFYVGQTDGHLELATASFLPMTAAQANHRHAA
jgi:hypothetical protein